MPYHSLNQIPSDIISSTGNVRIKFKADECNHHSGFKLGYMRTELYDERSTNKHKLIQDLGSYAEKLANRKRAHYCHRFRSKLAAKPEVWTECANGLLFDLRLYEYLAASFSVKAKAKIYLNV